MFLQYIGTTEKIKQKCSLCGKGSYVNRVMTTTEIICPSGRTYTFRIGKVQEVKNQKDCDFMLKLDYIKKA